MLSISGVGITGCGTVLSWGLNCLVSLWATWSVLDRMLGGVGFYGCVVCDVLLNGTVFVFGGSQWSFLCFVHWLCCVFVCWCCNSGGVVSSKFW